MNVKLICMSFDGDYVTERPEFESIEDAWEYSNDLGSKWFFYPFHFVVTSSGKTIKSAGYMLEHMEGLRVDKVAKIFKEASLKPESQGLDVEVFTFFLFFNN